MRQTPWTCRRSTPLRDKVANRYDWILKEVQDASPPTTCGCRHGHAPAPREARRAVDAAGIPYKYLEYGSYLKMWRPRTTLKMWTGWHTFPRSS